MARRKSVLQRAANTHFANYLRSIGEVPLAATARAAAMCERARIRHNNRQKESTPIPPRPQDPALGEPGSSRADTGAESSGLGAGDGAHLGDLDSQDDAPPDMDEPAHQNDLETELGSVRTGLPGQPE